MSIIIFSIIWGVLAFVGGLCATIAQTQALDVTKAKVVDLTHPIDSSTIYWPTWKRRSAA